MKNTLGWIQKHKTEKLFLTFKGFALGMSIVIPGVSAGTMAVITGLYSVLIQFLSSSSMFLFKKKSLKIRELFLYLIPVWIGMGLGFLLSVQLVSRIVSEFPILSYSFFSGVILASTPFLFRQIKISYSRVCIFILTAGLSFSLSFLSGIFVDGWIWFLMSVFLSVTAMLLPGVSGSYVLMITGTYSRFLEAFSTFSLDTLWAVCMGVLSLLFSSFLIQRLLKKCHAVTITSLAGLTFGGGLGVFPLYSKIEWIQYGWSSSFLLLAGALLVFVFHCVSSMFSKA